MFQLMPLIQTAGYLGVFGMIFAETGLLVGFFFPGDTLLFTAGVLASQGFFNIDILLSGAAACAVAGGLVGYWIGKKIGPKLFVREDSLFFKKDYVERTNRFFERYGKKTIFLARFVPVVRTFVPVVAGVGKMKYKSFFSYNLLGGAVWCLSVGLTGYFLGQKISNIDHYVLPIVLGILVVSFLPVIFQFFRAKNTASTI